jgi:hypothetical protein
MRAKLPPSLEEVNLKSLCNGMSVYVVPWAMYAEEDGSLYLNGNYTFSPRPGGTENMKVTK